MSESAVVVGNDPLDHFGLEVAGVPSLVNIVSTIYCIHGSDGMSSHEVDYDALGATTSVEEITENERNRDILRSLKDDNLPALWICAPDLANDHEDYVLGGSKELSWLGHFAKKSTCLERFGILGGAIFDSCSEKSVDRFFEDLGLCNHIKKMDFAAINLDEIIYKLGPAMKNNNITHWSMEGCQLEVLGANLLFNTFRDMNSLEDLCIICDSDIGDEEMTDLNDDDMTEFIPLLAPCTGMRKLKLNGLNLSTRSCAALGGVFPRMTALLELSLGGNSIDDDCARVLAQGLSKCTHLQSLVLSRNSISDNGLDALIQGLPASVDTLNLARNEVTLARHLLLLRFKKLVLWGNPLSIDGPRVIAASLDNPECRLEELNLNSTNIRDDGAAALAEGVRNNQRLARMSLYGSTIRETGWNAFSSILCDAGSINATHGSNHTLQNLGDANRIPQDVKMLLKLNSDEDKCRVAANKILQTHHHLDMRPLFGREMGLLPYVVAWLERFAESRLDIELSALYEFARAMPMKVVEGVAGTTNGKKRKLNN